MAKRNTQARKAADGVHLAASADAPQACDYDLALHPHDMGHDVRLWGTEVELPPGDRLTVGYAAGGDGDDDGKPMVVQGTRAEVTGALRAAGYRVAGEEAAAEPARAQPAERAPETVAETEQAARDEAVAEAAKRIEHIAGQLAAETRRLHAAAERAGSSAAERSWRSAFVLTPLRLLLLATRRLIDGIPEDHFEPREETERRRALEADLEATLARGTAEIERLNERKSGGEPLDDLPIR